VVAAWAPTSARLDRLVRTRVPWARSWAARWQPCSPLRCCRCPEGCWWWAPEAASARWVTRPVCITRMRSAFVKAAHRHQTRPSRSSGAAEHRCRKALGRRLEPAARARTRSTGSEKARMGLLDHTPHRTVFGRQGLTGARSLRVEVWIPQAGSGCMQVTVGTCRPGVVWVAGNSLGWPDDAERPIGRG
jgi:hypothetical protein